MDIRISIEGRTPLICNRFHEAAQLAASAGSRISSTAGDRGTPREQCEPKLYTTRDGMPMIPGANVFSCLIEAGKFFKAGKNKLTTQKTSLIPAWVSIYEAELPIEYATPWDVDARAIGLASGGRTICYRPIFYDWKLHFTIDLDATEMSPKLFREVVDAAGKKIGLGDFRPARKGPYGRFNVIRWEVEQVPLSEVEAA